ncbi:MAG: PCRF domain-containing protein [Candidatus Blackburnbacteria bacterium]|nr:PCRF domain-containing protein [Candidatus Blackburnbacteria bacterium]
MNPQELQTIYLEIRPAAGGDEAKIWATDLSRMYMRFGIKKGWKVTPIDDGVIKISGAGAFSVLKNEGGVHRVQRIPKTERRGRIHTSTATVAVIPYIRQGEIKIRPEDLEWQFYRASSQGGQNVQKVSSAVRLIHKPSGIVVTAQQERFQEQNRQIAQELLAAKLYERQEKERQAQIQEYRQAIGSGERSEKIRTYNFPQDRVTDHRVGKSWGNLESILDGELDKIINITQGVLNSR